MTYLSYNTNIFINEAKKVHKNKYDYSLVEYKNCRTKVKIICPTHGIFSQLPGHHLKGQGCPICFKDKNKSTLEDFITKANKVHHNFYDYSLVDYKSSQKKVKIICPIHGIFEQIPNSHLIGKKCIKCSKKYTLTLEEFKDKANKIHKNKYDYSLVEYKHLRQKVKIICPEHNIFEQTLCAHLQGQGCPKCNISNKLTLEEFINKANLVHNNKYDYSLVDYINSLTKVKIICPTHGIFNQLANNHLCGSGCPSCFKANQSSKGEKEVLEYIKSIYNDEIIENDRIILEGKELDIYLPKLNIGIEYNGEYWHKLREEENPGYHKLKEKLCQEKKIKLINISDNDWTKDKEKIKSILCLNLMKF